MLVEAGIGQINPAAAPTDIISVTIGISGTRQHEVERHDGLQDIAVINLCPPGQGRWTGTHVLQQQGWRFGSEAGDHGTGYRAIHQPGQLLIGPVKHRNRRLHRQRNDLAQPLDRKRHRRLHQIGHGERQLPFPGIEIARPVEGQGNRHRVTSEERRECPCWIIKPGSKIERSNLRINRQLHPTGNRSFLLLKRQQHIFLCIRITR